jgi:hypothetical protein
MITSAAAAALLGVTPRRVQALCAQGRIRGAKKIGRDWMLPDQPRISAGTRGPALRHPAVL